MIALLFVAPLVLVLTFGYFCQRHYGTNPWVDGATYDQKDA